MVPAQQLVYLLPSQGSVLVLHKKETWIGRGTFAQSEQVNSFCSRKQACLHLTNSTLQLECHGLNPIYFVTCHAIDFNAKPDTPCTGLYALKKGEVMELTDGDKFFLASTECLVTVGIKLSNLGQDGAVVPFSSDAALPRAIANNLGSPKATQKEQPLAIGLDNSFGSPQRNKLRNSLATDVGIASISNCLTSREGYFGIADKEFSSRTCVGEGKCVTGNSSPTPLSENPISLSNNVGDATVNDLGGSVSGAVVLTNCGNEPRRFPDMTCGLELHKGTTISSSSSTPDGACEASVATEFRASDVNPPMVQHGATIASSSQKASLSEILQDSSAGDCCALADNPLSNREVSVDPAEPSQTLADMMGSRLIVDGSGLSEAEEDQSCKVTPGLNLEQHLVPRCEVQGHSRKVKVPRAEPTNHMNSELEGATHFLNSIDIKKAKAGLGASSSEITRSPEGGQDQNGASDTSARVLCESLYKSNVRGTVPTDVEVVDLNSPERTSIQVDTSIPASILHVESQISEKWAVGPVPGMDSVIATVSGYEELLRMRLIRLINLVGASYVGSLTKSNTHLVCWKFEGSRYEMAKKLGTTVISHRWFEDCLKAGARIPEEAYIDKSGEFEEPLCWNDHRVPSSRVKTSVTIEKCCPPHVKRSTNSHIVPSTLVGRPGVGRSQLASAPSISQIYVNNLGQGPIINLSDGEEEPCPRALKVDIEDTGVRPHLETCLAAGDGQGGTSGPSHLVQEQESDDFWNEVIRACDDKGKQVLNSSNKQVKKETGGSGGSEARVSREDQNQNHNQPEHSGNAWHDNHLCPDSSDSPQLHLKKRKQVETFLSGGNGKYRRLVKTKPQVRTPSNLANIYESAAGSSRSINVEALATIGASSMVPGSSPVDVEVEHLQHTDVRVSHKMDVSSSAIEEISCVICHTEAKPTTEGVLECGHRFCYPCIQKWADEAKLKQPTCPLCKASFEFITVRVKDTVNAEGTCTQVLEERVVPVGKHVGLVKRAVNLPALRTETLCLTCGSTDTPELLLVCGSCFERACHTFCLDPPQPTGSSWFCPRCTQTRSRHQTIDTYARIFYRGSSRGGTDQHEHMDIPNRLGATSREVNDRLNDAVFGSSRLGGRISRTPPRRGRQANLLKYVRPR